jgi:replicative DNA helicase
MDGAVSRVHALPSPGPTGERFDRVPPHNLDAEVSVVGSMLLDKDAIAEVTEIIGPEDFYRGAHRTMFEAIRDLYDRGEPVDAITLGDELGKRGTLDDIGGQVAIADILSRVPTSANALHYARIVAAHALRRRLIETGTQITRIGYDDTEGIDEAVDTAEQLVYNVAQHGRVSEFTPMKQLLTEGFAIIEKLHENNSAITGLATGFTDFDELTSGLQPSNLVILAARPAMGKCLSGSTLVLDPISGSRRRIDELVDAGRRGEPTAVATLSRSLRLSPTSVSHFHDNGVQPVFRLRTRLGREVVATANHPFLTMGGWVQLSELREGQRVATPRALPYFGTRALPESEVALLAYLIGDGSLGGSGCRFTTNSDVLLADVRRHAAAIGVQVKPVGTNTLSYALVTRRGAPNPLLDRVRAHGLGGSTSATKFVPQAIFEAPRGQVALFLNRLFACDGSVYRNEQYAQVTYTTISERLARDLQHLLLRFGIVAKLRELARPVYEGTDKRAWELQVTDPQGVRTFAADIGILGKDERLAAAVALFDSRTGGSPNRDLVPAEVWNRILEVRGQRTWRELSVATGRPAGHNWHVGQRAPSRALLGEIVAVWPDEVVQDLATSDVYWDEIVSIEPAGEERVYDLTVPGDHNFVAEDVILHNSTLVTNIAVNVAVEQRKPAVLFSLEMSKMELVQRVLAAEARVDSDRLRTGRLQESDWPKLSQAMGRLAEAPLFIDDTPGINMMEIRSKSRRLKQKHGLDLIIVDYLQLMQSHRRVENRVQEVSELSRGLKILAKELDVPVIALSQLSRRPEERTDRRPQLADLRESGSIEQDADIVAFIYRDEVYNPDTAAKGEAELIVSKHRSGPLKTVHLAFLGSTSRFANLRRGPGPGAGGPPSGGPPTGGFPPGPPSGHPGGPL